jgi:hypothetical protein
VADGFRRCRPHCSDRHVANRIEPEVAANGGPVYEDQGMRRRLLSRDNLNENVFCTLIVAPQARVVSYGFANAPQYPLKPAGFSYSGT